MSVEGLNCKHCHKGYTCKTRFEKHEGSCNKKKTIKFIDLCCGIGSFHNSFKKLGWECILSSDIDETTHEPYEKNYGIRPLGDLYKIDPKKIKPYDILCAGFPCQSFSQAGQHKGFDDSRGQIFHEIMKFVKTNKPKVVVLENVSALLNHDNGGTFITIKGLLEKENYIIRHKILKCSDYGIPQMRKRLFIVCVKKDIKLKKDINEIFNLTKYERDVSLKEYLQKDFEKKYAYTIRCGGKGSKIDNRHNWDGYWVDKKEYRLTIEDALRLQGFDENFIMTEKNKDKWRHLGNTIPTIFTEIVGKQLKDIVF